MHGIEYIGLDVQQRNDFGRFHRLAPNSARLTHTPIHAAKETSECFSLFQG